MARNRNKSSFEWELPEGPMGIVHALIHRWAHFKLLKTNVCVVPEGTYREGKFSLRGVENIVEALRAKLKKTSTHTSNRRK